MYHFSLRISTNQIINGNKQKTWKHTSHTLQSKFPINFLPISKFSDKLYHPFLVFVHKFFVFLGHIKIDSVIFGMPHQFPMKVIVAFRNKFYLLSLLICNYQSDARNRIFISHTSAAYFFMRKKFCYFFSATFHWEKEKRA